MTPILEEDRRTGVAPLGYGVRRPANNKASAASGPEQSPATPPSFTPTASFGVVRRGNSFADAPGAQSQLTPNVPQGPGFGAVPGSPAAQRESAGGEMPNPGQTSTGAGATPAPASAGSAADAGTPAGFGARRPTTTQSAPTAETQAVGFGANQQALARLQVANSTQVPVQAPEPAPRGFDANRAASTLNDLRSPQYIALRNAAVGGITRSGYNGLFNELTAGARQAEAAQMQDAGQTQRTGMQEAGATGRTVMTEGGNMARALMTNSVDQGRLDLERQGFGVKTRAARQIEEAQQRYLNARTPEERAQAAQAIRVLSGKDEQPTAPSGYRWAAGGNLQAIAGGPADRSRDPKLTEDQAKSAGYAVRMENSLNLLNGINQSNPGATRPGAGTALLNTLPESVANMVRPEDRQRVEAAQLDALDAALTLNTGAAYTREQLQGMSRSYFAQPGDSDKTVQEKKARLGSLIETARLRAGPQGNQMADAALERGRQGAQQPTGQPQAAQIPQPGEVRRGYRFKGGNPSDQANWESAQ